ncbi:hypothetical protein O7622_20325 [Micromonospora sp. WMMD1076]|uniref:diacylglycerol/lipid kinase family protein n=1 Tax=Micromonospora sp. WMMD1076 TaxID=3016103 RepID=UPI00249AC8E0|nr:hypothetical protein [Micromonospora sp. WMMD1076]WFF05397.1 hypothetical protein O7622_20325 [Micromonospora sp. WMMD1076]
MDTRTAERPDTTPAPAAPPAGVVAVVAHRKKTIGGGLDELRSRLVSAGVGRLLWYEVPKSRKTPERVRAALDEGRVGRIAYVWTGLRHVRGECVRTRIRVDGTDWFDAEASCVLFGDVGTITGGIPAFDDARPDDGAVEVGVSTASGAVDWARTLGRMAAGHSEESPFVRITRGRKIRVRFDAPKTYEVDGGARGKAKRLKVKVVPGALTVCCPDPAD